MSAPPPAEGPYPLPYTVPSGRPLGEEIPAAAGQDGAGGPIGPDGPSDPGARERPAERRWLAPVCAAVIAGVLGIFAGVALSPAPDPEQTPAYLTLAEERAQLADERDQLQDERDGLADELADVRASQDDLIAEVEQREADTDERESALDERETGLDERSASLDEREAGLDEREAELEEAEEEARANTISDGDWTVGSDIRPGTYRTTETVSGFCYWAIYRSGTNQDVIINNDIVTGGRPTVTLREGQDFETSDCGEWRRQ